MGHFQGITCVSTPNDFGSSKYVLSNSKDQSMKLWDLRSMNSVSELSSARGNLRGLTAQFDYRYDISGDQFSNRKQFKGDKSLMTYRGHSVSTTLCRSGFSPIHSTSAKYVYCGSADCSVFVYETLTGEVHCKLDGHDHIVRDVCWHPFLPVIVSASWDGTVARWCHRGLSGNGSVLKGSKRKLGSGPKIGGDAVDGDFKAIQKFLRGQDEESDVSESDEESDFEGKTVSLDMPAEKRKRGHHDYW